MEKPTSFAEWMKRVRSGDEQAAVELVKHYEQAIRVAVQVRLTDPRVRRLVDSSDVCQSVMASFFVRAAAGQFDLDDPQQLIALLVKMARNKLNMQVRRNRAQRRDVGREAAPTDSALPCPHPQPGPERHAAARELLDKLLAQLNAPERELAQRRALGQGWNDIARDLGGTPQGHRMRLARAIDRLAPELGLDDADEEPG